MQSHAIDPIKISKGDKKLSVLATLCESCFEEGEKRNTTSTEKDDDLLKMPNLNLEAKPEHIFHGIGKIALNNQDEMFDEEGTPIDAEVTIVIKLNKNSNSNTVVKKFFLDNLENLEEGLKQNLANFENFQEGLKQKHE